MNRDFWATLGSFFLIGVFFGWKRYLLGLFFLLISLPSMGKTLQKLQTQVPEILHPPPAPVTREDDHSDQELRLMADVYRRKTLRLSSTLVRLKGLCSTLDKDEIYASFTEIVVKGLEAERVQLLGLDEPAGTLRVLRAEGMSREELAQVVIPFSDPSLVAFIASHARDEKAEHAVFGNKECGADPRTRGCAGSGMLQTLLAAPIFVGGNLFGIINVEKMKEPDYSKDDQSFLAFCAAIAGLALEKAFTRSGSPAASRPVPTPLSTPDQRQETFRTRISQFLSPQLVETIMAGIPPDKPTDVSVLPDRPRGPAPVISCTHCGNPNEVQTKFCQKCGRPIF